jgi:hypothetical protein
MGFPDFHVLNPCLLAEGFQLVYHVGHGDKPAQPPDFKPGLR